MVSLARIKEFALQKQITSTVKRVGLGALVGGANSLFGGGGGMIAVPLLTAAGMQEKQAHATAILIILPISLFSFLLYTLNGYFNGAVLVPTAIGVALGGWLGAQLLNKLPTKAVNIAFAFLQFLAGAFLLFMR